MNRMSARKERIDRNVNGKGKGRMDKISLRGGLSGNGKNKKEKNLDQEGKE
jgi:hypothetical protein